LTLYISIYIYIVRRFCFVLPSQETLKRIIHSLFYTLLHTFYQCYTSLYIYIYVLQREHKQSFYVYTYSCFWLLQLYTLVQCLSFSTWQYQTHYQDNVWCHLIYNFCTKTIPCIYSLLFVLFIHTHTQQMYIVGIYIYKSAQKVVYVFISFTLLLLFSLVGFQHQPLSI